MGFYIPIIISAYFPLVPPYLTWKCAGCWSSAVCTQKCLFWGPNSSQKLWMKLNKSHLLNWDKCPNPANTPVIKALSPLGGVCILHRHINKIFYTDSDHIANKITSSRDCNPVFQLPWGAPASRLLLQFPLLFLCLVVQKINRRTRGFPPTCLPVLSHGSCGLTRSKQYLNLHVLLPGETQQPVHQQSTCLLFTDKL